MRKKTWDYIQMGLRSKENTQQKRAEEEARIKEEAKAFNKTFTDKTYSVAKKVIENVEKVSNYDYEKLFDRVKHDIEDKINTDSIKVKVNIGGEKNKNSKNRPNVSNNSGFSSNSNVKNVIITPRYEKKSSPNNKNIKPAQMAREIQKQIFNDINKSMSDLGVPFYSEKVNKSNNETITNKKESIKFNLKPEAVKDSLSMSSESKNNCDSKEEKKIDIKESKEIITESKNKVVSEDVIELTTSSNKVEPVSIEVIDSTDIKLNVEIKNDEIQEKTIAADYIEEKIVTENIVVDNFTFDEPLATVAQEKEILEKNSNTNESITSTKTDTEESNLDEELKTQTRKDNRVFGDKYYKQQRREKFAKKMKVELDDTLIVQKKRSLTRLFKFSLAFKLSFVFIFLMIITVVTLSVGFYFGIDYVIDLKNAGKLEDIEMFKNVLFILLIIFNLSAILLYVSVGAKSSRNLVRPLDEMTKIVQQINGEAMDRRLNVTGMHDELKELAVTFNEMLERIELAYETQNRFTSDASHELRTPIAVIQGYVNMLDRWGKADGEILDESIEAIKSEANNMKRLTEKLLLLAKADKGILEMNFEEFSLKKLIEEITRETHMIDSKHEITNEINAVDLILGDRPSLKQALRIFVDNSVKYTPEGGRIAINAYHRKKGVYIEISDNGIGISEEDMKKVFNRFYRADLSRTKASGGHGLGLSIAKWIIKEHKGEIEIKSEVNKGTVVTIFLSSS